MEFRSFTFNTSSPNTAPFAFLLTLCALAADSLLFGAYASSTIGFEHFSSFSMHPPIENWRTDGKLDVTLNDDGRLT